MMRFSIRSNVAVDPLDIPHTEIRDAEGPTERYNPHAFRTHIYAADTDDKDAIVADIEAALTSAEWARVDYRHTNAEYAEAKYRDDAEYYHLAHELRTPPAIEWVDGYDVRVEWWGGEDAETLPEPDGYAETHAIERDGVTLGWVTVKKPLDRIPRSGIEVRAYPDATDEPETVVVVGEEPTRDPPGKRLHQLERATGKEGKGQRGISHRLDDIEDRLAELEGK